MLTTLEELLNEYYLAMREGQAALFVGAGMSTPVGLPDWKELGREARLRRSEEGLYSRAELWWLCCARGPGFYA